MTLLTLLLIAPSLHANPKLPLEFEANAGQFDPTVLYLARTSNHYVYLSRDGVVLGNSALRISFPGAQTDPRGESPTGGVTNYLIGNDPAQWRRGVPRYASIRYPSVWRGIDLVLHGRDQSLEYDFVVSRDSDPSKIRLRYDNALSLRVDRNGDLLVRTAYGEVRQHRPEIYQTVDGKRQTIRGRFRILSARETGFEVGRYDRSHDLVIDPVLTYSTFLAGTGTAKLNAMALDSSGSVYLTGKVSSPDFPLVGATAPASTGSGLYRRNEAGAWAQLGSGVGPSKILALAADPKNNATVYAGTSHGVFKTVDGGLTWKSTAALPLDAINGVSVDFTNSTVYAATNEGLFQSADGGATWKQLLTTPVTCVISAPTRPGLIYAGRPAAPILRSFDGGASWQEVGVPVTTNGLAIDPTNSQTVYAATSRSGFYVSTDNGNTWTFSNLGMANGVNPLTVNAVAIDPRIPQRLYAATTAGLYRSSDGGVVWTPAGTGIGTRNVLSISINPANGGEVYVGAAAAGLFRSADGGDTWVSAGLPNLDANAVAVDAAGQFVHTGLWIGTQTFVSKLNAAGTALAYSTYVGGAGVSEGRAITVDGTGRAHVCGATDAADFPSRNAYQPALAGSRDAFFLRLNPAGSDLDYSGFLGGHGDEVCEGIALDSNSNLYLMGNTYTTAGGASTNDFPTSTGAFQRSSPGGGQDCFVTKFDDTARRLTYSTYFGGSATDTCNGFAVDRQGFVYLAGTTKSPNIPLNQPAFGGTISTPPVLRFNAGFFTRLTADGSDISYSVLLGSSTADSEIDGLALDQLGRVHLTGSTRATDFPMTANALATAVPQQGKTFVSVVDPNFNKLVYSTVLPGAGSDIGWRIQPDIFGNPWITGNAFPAAGNPTPFVAQIDITASKLLQRTNLAGSQGGIASAIAVATDGTVYAAGSALSTDFPVQGGPFQTAKNADYALYVQHLDFSQPSLPQPVITAIANGASFVRGLSPGAVIAIFGTNLATTKPADTSVSIDGKNIPLFYVSATQVNAQIPYELGPSTPVLRVTVNGVSSAPGSLEILPAAPGIFLVGNRAAVTNADNNLNTAANPATAGSTITIYFTGIGPLDNPVPTGAPAPLSGPLSRATLPVTVTIGGQRAAVAYVGLTPGSIALAQANVVVPNLPSGDYPVVITIGGFDSNGPAISVAAQ
jgi:uncharacterized protein (TIGR03437 family)